MLFNLLLFLNEFCYILNVSGGKSFGTSILYGDVFSGVIVLFQLCIGPFQCDVKEHIYTIVHT